MSQAARRLNSGKELENKLREALAEDMKRTASFFHRFYDTTSARNMLPTQPGDFLWVFPGAAVLMEAKSTVAGDSLLEMLRGGGDHARTQIAKHKLWLRAGHPTVFWWADLRTGDLEVHSGRRVVRAFNDKVPCTALLTGCLATIPGLLAELRHRLERGDDE